MASGAPHGHPSAYGEGMGRGQPGPSQPRVAGQQVQQRKCQVLHLQRNNPMHQYVLRATQTESSFAEKYMRVNKLNMSQKCALVVKANRAALGKALPAGRWKQSFLSELVRPYLSRRDMDILESVQQTATKMMKRLEHLSYEERLRAGTVQPGEEKVEGDFINRAVKSAELRGTGRVVLLDPARLIWVAQRDLCCAEV
ncbi:hypothetical protein QYF61_019343 [Mycteria americana]|uniref:Uncharacterized protein n=1 Tax=Mycteria americana TaxID=33587 RepID=A0AAN7PKC5_MYCAM|nr:hypothetical protein QYF61_019343 [Mycteria americana]